jgi:hypothetical protein
MLNRADPLVGGSDPKIIAVSQSTFQPMRYLMITNGVGVHIPMASAVSTEAHGVSARGASSRRGSLQLSHFDAEIEQQGQLKVTTADGDTVTISIAELDRLQSDSSSDTSGGSTASFQKTRASSSIAANIEVDGSLDDKEVADITKLLRDLVKVSSALASGQGAKAAGSLQNIGALDSIKSFQFAYQEDTFMRVDLLTNSSG